jgi:hypothetical protein
MKRPARSVAIVAFAALGAGTGCITFHAPTFTTPESERAWPHVLSAARSDASEGSFDAADTILAKFAARYPSTGEALETAYWRAIFKMDPKNPHASLPAAIQSLDGYLTDERPRLHVSEATTIRRIAAQLDAMNKLAASALAQAQDANTSAATARAQALNANARAESKVDGAQAAADTEIKRLKEELAKANAELERIRKRLTQAPGKPQNPEG